MNLKVRNKTLEDEINKINEEKENLRKNIEDIKEKVIEMGKRK